MPIQKTQSARGVKRRLSALPQPELRSQREKPTNHARRPAAQHHQTE